MRKEDKNSIIEQIAATVKEYGHFYLVDVTAMNATATSALRRDCFKSDIKLMVVKNTLLHKALESLEEDFSPLYGSLKGTTAVMFCNTANVPAKLIRHVLATVSVLTCDTSGIVFMTLESSYVAALV